MLDLNLKQDATRRFILIELGRPESGDTYAKSLTANRLTRVQLAFATATGAIPARTDVDTTTLSTFVVNVRGVVAPGTACTSDLFKTGVLGCAGGTSCSAGICQ